jgi:hypothetical protein
MLPKRLTTSLCAAALCGAWWSSAQAADIYKWVDEKGTTHYSNEKPKGVKASVMAPGRLSIIPGDRIGAEAARAATSSSPASEAQTVDPEQVARQQRREQLMKDCHENNGVDCAREVDTQMRSERLQESAIVVHQAPANVKPTVIIPPSTPNVPGTKLR